MRRFGLRVILIGLSVNVLVGAGQPPEKEKRKDPQSAFEPRSAAGRAARIISRHSSATGRSPRPSIPGRATRSAPGGSVARR